ncbi:MAG: sigma-70 family RNA polymerase sigma factor [Planctomycetes bacterium]|nr:sigma-70 family RNA polymerase sigma factor [Planctomycetota bacterium]
MSVEGAVRDEGDRFLLARIRAADPEAFRQLVDRYSGRLRAFASRLVAGTGLEPEDAVQETFLSLLESIDRLPPIRSLQAFLFAIVRNKAMDLIRRSPQAHGIEVRSFGGTAASGAPEPMAAAETPSARVGREELEGLREEVLADALEDLVERWKREERLRDLKILELLFYRSWKSRDIARAVGTSEPTVSRRKDEAVSELAAVAARRARDAAAADLPLDGDLLARIWRENLLSCIKRSTLGAYELGVLEEPWAEHVAFHIQVVACEACNANLADLREGSSPEARRARERIFQSSVGFLRGPEGRKP